MTTPTDKSPLEQVRDELARWFDSASGIPRNWIDFENEARNILYIFDQLVAQGYAVDRHKVMEYLLDRSIDDLLRCKVLTPLSQSKVAQQGVDK